MIHTPENIFDGIADLLPEDSREYFYRRMARLRDLNPEDDMLQIAEAMGFLALLIRQTPSELATERMKFAALFEQTATQLKGIHDSTVAYQRKIDERLQNLPAEVALALDRQKIASFLSESVRQSFQEAGLPAVSSNLARYAEDLRDTCQQLGTTIESFSHPENGAVNQIGRALTRMQANLENGGNHIRALSHALVKDLHRALTILCLGSLIVGLFLGRYLCPWVSPH